MRLDNFLYAYATMQVCLDRPLRFCMYHGLKRQMKWLKIVLVSTYGTQPIAAKFTSVEPITWRPCFRTRLPTSVARESS